MSFNGTNWCPDTDVCNVCESALPNPSWRKYSRIFMACKNTERPRSQGARQSVCSIYSVRSGETSVLRISPSHPWVFQHPSQLSIHESPFPSHLMQNKPCLPVMHPSGRDSTVPFLPLGGQCIFHSGLKNPCLGPWLILPYTGQPDGRGNTGVPKWRCEMEWMIT